MESEVQKEERRFPGWSVKLPKDEWDEEGVWKTVSPKPRAQSPTRFSPLPVLSQRGCQGSSEASWSSVMLPWTLGET